MPPLAKQARIGADLRVSMVQLAPDKGRDDRHNWPVLSEHKFFCRLENTLVTSIFATLDARFKFFIKSGRKLALFRSGWLDKTQPALSSAINNNRIFLNLKGKSVAFQRQARASRAAAIRLNNTCDRQHR